MTFKDFGNVMDDQMEFDCEIGAGTRLCNDGYSNR
jgi:hypothetical protein